MREKERACAKHNRRQSAETLTRVQVYRNLNKPGVVYSLRDAKTGRVVGYGSDVLLSNVKFRVRQGGRERVLREQRKNVHAFAEGDLVEIDSPSLGRMARQFEADLGPWQQIRYNPYKYSSFVRAADERPVKEALFARVGPRGVDAILDGEPALPNARRTPIRELLDEQLLWQDVPS